MGSSFPAPLRLTLALLWQLGLSAAIQWLGLMVNGSKVAWNETQHCKILDGLVPDQLQLCRRNLELMHSIVHAAKETKGVCQKTFSDMRWNCSSIEYAPSFTPDLLKGTRESAFVYALAAAAVSHSIARACASGELPICSCGSVPSEVPGPGFRWGGCGDNLRYGLQMGSAFADGPMKSSKAGGQATRLMNLHNNAVGRQVLIDSLETKCKCHGVSGSCSVKTCWKGLQDLSEIAIDLKSKYLAAIKVTHRHMGTRKQLVPKELDIRPVREAELVYLVSSPDYCTKNPKLGSLGTQDSQNEDLEEIASADLKYLLLPALLGALTMKQVNLSKRLEHVQSARTHFMDFLKLCKNYQIGKFHLPPTPESPNENEPTESTSGAGPAGTQSSLVAMASGRQAKIERYKQKKEVENRLASMKAFVESGQAEEEQIREFYVLQIQKWITTSLDEIESIDQEIVILRGRNALKQASAPPQTSPRPRTAMKPFILTRDAMQAKVLGAGYPSLATMTVNDWYEQRCKQGIMPDKGKPQTTAADLSEEELQKEQQEKKVEEDDEETLQKTRAWEDWKDTHPRGFGNRKNMG